MDVELYVYDLSQGMARTLSRSLLGIQIDAVYHTAIVIERTEYFYGAGVQTAYPGSTHHGQPMEKIKLGRTDLPLEIVLEYLESLKQIYTAEAYDLFLHNCNNFTNDFSMFLVGKGIPDHITSLPQHVLNTPFGQMIKPQLDAMMRPITQAPVRHPQTEQLHATNARPSSDNSHPHKSLRLPKLLSSSLRPITYTKVPPLDKVIAKLGSLGQDPIITDVKKFIEAIHGARSAQNAPVPALPALASLIQKSLTMLPTNELFAAYDLFRLVVADVRVGAYFAEEKDTATILQLMQHINKLSQEAPYNLRVVSLHVACNLFASKLAAHVLLAKPAIVKELIALVTSSLLDEGHVTVRVAASCLSFNLAYTNHLSREKNGPNRAEPFGEDEQAELVAAIVEAIGREEESKETVKALALALGLLMYCAPVNGGVLELCDVMDASAAIKGKLALSGEDAVLKEVMNELL